MPALTHLLVQFIFRLTLGLALAMGLTNSRLVTSGYYRVHLWVLMGLNTLAALAIWSNRDYTHWSAVFALAVGIAVASYVGAVVWLYEQARVGMVLLFGVAIAALVAAALAADRPAEAMHIQRSPHAPRADTSGGSPPVRTNDALSPPVYAAGSREVSARGACGLRWMRIADIATGGWLLGVIMAAMLLGHWYLNTPTMQLAPLKKLVLLVMLAIALRGLQSAAGIALNLAAGEAFDMTSAIFLLLRWLAGIVGTGLMAAMTWQVLKVPNTQSATGILYAAVILSFLGELASLLLSVELRYPV